MKEPGWKELFSNKREVMMSIITLAVAALAITSYTSFLRQVEQRVGMAFTDPIHRLFQPIDLSWPIFIILYGALVGAIVITMSKPHLILRMIRAYTILIAIRILCMWLLPLDPPATMIVLADPFAEVFAANGGVPLTRDLFFSGHTSLMCMVGLMMPTKTTRYIFLTLSVLIGVAVIAQHVHYTIDVVVAPLAALTAVVLVGANKSS